MAETSNAATSPAETPDVFNGENVSMSEFSKYRSDGQLPERFKTADTADPAPASEETPAEVDEDAAPDSAPEATQEKPKLKPKQTAEERIAQLEATIEKIRKGAGIKETQADSSPAKPAPQQQPQYRHPKPTPEDKNPDGTLKFKDYEEVVEAIGRWAAKEERAQWEQEAAEKAQAKEFNDKAEEARARYENFDEVVSPFANALNTDPQVSPIIRQMFLDSPVTADLLFTIGSDEAESAKFLKMSKGDVGKAIRYLAVTESLITKALEGKKTPTDEEPPVKKTAAPKPPSPVGGTSSRAFDVSDESLSPEQWMRKRNQQLAARN